jgi:hypothetical protein
MVPKRRDAPYRSGACLKTAAHISLAEFRLLNFEARSKIFGVVLKIDAKRNSSTSRAIGTGLKIQVRKFHSQLERRRPWPVGAMLRRNDQGHLYARLFVADRYS